jgi:poly-gamma-glutamate capsule biosynthesis protein CapA/YwtB (metallophosphatase superfamily)
MNPGMSITKHSWHHAYAWLNISRCYGLVFVFLLAACGKTTSLSSPDSTVLQEETSTLAVSLQPNSGLSQNTKPAPTIVLIPTPTPTPKPVILAITESFESIAINAIHSIEGENASLSWDIVVGDDPGEILAQGKAQFALVQSSDGILVGTRPIALGVPFTQNWEDVNWETAQIIFREGHDLVVIQEWYEMPPTYKPLRIDGLLPYHQEYPLQQEWSLVSLPEYGGVVSKLALALQEAFTEEPIIRLAAVGDVMLDRALGTAIVQDDPGYPFAKVAELLTSADLAIGNLESAIGDIGEPEDKNYTFRAPSQAVETLAIAGFDVLSLANNHALDYGEDALVDAIEKLNEHNIVTVGAGVDKNAAHTPMFVESGGLTLAFLAYVNVPVEGNGFDTKSWEATETDPGIAWADPERIREDVERAKLSSDIVIVLLHGGYEYITAPNDVQVASAHAAIEAGATLVLGHHAHTLQPIEFYQGGVIAYGLGNFAFQDAGPPETAILMIWLDRKGVRQLELIPALILYDGRPTIAPPDRADEIRSWFYGLTSYLLHSSSQ